MFSTCGACSERVEAESALGLLDAIRLHCREYHPTFGDHGRIFDRLYETMVSLYMITRDEDDEQPS